MLARPVRNFAELPELNPTLINFHTSLFTHKRGEISNGASPVRLRRTAHYPDVARFFGAPGRNRTCGHMLRRHVLYPLSYGRII